LIALDEALDELERSTRELVAWSSYVTSAG
jgi:hypothetical protein